MKRKMLLILVVVLVISVLLPTVAMASWRSEQYSIYVTNQIDSARLDKGGTAYTWDYGYDYNTTSYRHGTSTTTQHRSQFINLDANAMGSVYTVDSGESQYLNIVDYRSERSCKVRFYKKTYSFDASGSVAARF